MLFITSSEPLLTLSPSPGLPSPHSVPVYLCFIHWSLTPVWQCLGSPFCWSQMTQPLVVPWCLEPFGQVLCLFRYCTRWEALWGQGQVWLSLTPQRVCKWASCTQSPLHQSTRNQQVLNSSLLLTWLLIFTAGARASQLHFTDEGSKAQREQTLAHSQGPYCRDKADDECSHSLSPDLSFSPVSGP